MSQFIGIGDELGRGSYKKAYKAIESLFTTTGLDINNLAIVSIASKLIQIDDIIKEIALQNEYANNIPQLAPKLYLVTIQYGNEFIKNILIDDFLENGKETFNDFLDANKTTTNAEPKIFFLEELCGPTPGKNQPLIIDNNFFDKVDELINNLITKSNLLFTDFKPQNTCPQYDASGNLENIMALDLDLKFSYSIDKIKTDINKKIKEQQQIEEQKQIEKEPIEVSNQLVFNFVKDYMFIQFYYVLLKYATNITSQNKIFIREEINKRLPPEKLLKQLLIFNVIGFEYVLSKQPFVRISDLADRFPIIKYVFTDINNNLYEEEYKKKSLNIDEPTFTTVIRNQLFQQISHILYTYSNNSLLQITNIVDIVNSPEKISLEDFKYVPEIDYNNSNKEEKPYSPINELPKPGKIEYPKEKKVDYDIDDGLFDSEGGKRKTKKNRINRRK